MIGLLWYDDESISLAQKIKRAAQRYRRKFGVAANVCYVHPSALDQKTQTVGGIHVEQLRSVLQHHFWIGIEEI